MNEEQAVLDFFAKPENLPLALSVAEQIDEIRNQMNNEFWRKAGARIADQLTDWKVVLTEDRNIADNVVGLSLQAADVGQTSQLRPMMEQQSTGKEIRIYFGLMWNAPTPVDKTSLPEIATLHGELQNAGYQSNENFPAWRWTSFYPRRKTFLLSLSTQPDELLDQATAPLLDLLSKHGAKLKHINTSLRKQGVSAAISLDQLHMNLHR